MKKKTKQLIQFIDTLHDHIVCHPQFRKNAINHTETQIQAEIRPIIVNHLECHFQCAGYSDYIAKAHNSFYWEGQEGVYGRERNLTFGARNYPDFIVTKPYLLAIEYKKGTNGGLVKQGIGQSIMHTLSGDFDYVYYLFHDQNKDKRIMNSMKQDKEKAILSKMQREFNVFVKIV